MAWYYTEPRPGRRPLDTPVRSGGGGTGGPPTGSAGGDLTGSYPNPDLAAGAVGTPELATGAVTNAKVTDVAYAKITGAPAIPTTLPPSGPAGGDLTGSYPNPTVGAAKVTRAKTAADCWLPPVPAGADVGKVLSVVTGPNLAWAATGTGASDFWIADASDPTAMTPKAPYDWLRCRNDAGGLFFGDAASAAMPGVSGNAGLLEFWAGASGVTWGTVDYATTLLTLESAGRLLLTQALVLADDALAAPPDGALRYSGGHVQGRITGAWQNLDGASGAAGGDLTGTYPNPTIAALAVGDAEISAVAWSKITGAPTSLPPSGAAGGDLAGTYPNPDIKALAVGTPELAVGAVTDAKVTDVAATKLTGTIAQARLPTAPSGLLTANLNDAQITDAKVADVAATKLTGTIAQASLPTAPSGLLTANLNDAQVTRAKIAADAWLAPVPVAGDVGDVLTVTAGPTLAWNPPAGGAPTGTASGDLSGTYPGPTVAKVNGAALGTTTPLTRGDLLVANATPQLARLAKGTTGQVLTATATDTVWAAPTGGAPTGTASGDLSGTYPGPTVAKVNGAALGTTTPLARGDLLVANATPALARLAKGATGTVLSATATDAAWQALTQSQLPTSPSGLTTANLNDGIVTFVKRETVQAQVKRTTTQSIPNAAETATIFDTIVSNVGGLYSAGTPDRFTIPAAGFYLIGGCANFGLGAAGTERDLVIAVNSLTAYTVTVNDAPRAASNNALCVTGGLLLAAGNIVYLVIWHDAGAALPVGQQAFWIVRVG